MDMREVKKMEFTFTLNSPLTEEDLDRIYDVDMDITNSVTFHTKHGKEVEFVKVVRCKDCRNSGWVDDSYGNKSMWCECLDIPVEEDHYCEYGEK